MENIQPFKKKDYEKLRSFMQGYDALYANIKVLEDSLQAILTQQKECVEDLESLRAEEEEFFQKISRKENIPVTALKRLATAWAMEKK